MIVIAPPRRLCKVRTWDLEEGIGFAPAWVPPSLGDIGLFIESHVFESVGVGFHGVYDCRMIDFLDEFEIVLDVI